MRTYRNPDDNDISYGTFFGSEHSDKTDTSNKKPAFPVRPVLLLIGLVGSVLVMTKDDAVKSTGIEMHQRTEQSLSFSEISTPFKDSHARVKISGSNTTSVVNESDIKSSVDHQKPNGGQPKDTGKQATASHLGVSISNVTCGHHSLMKLSCLVQISAFDDSWTEKHAISSGNIAIKYWPDDSMLPALWTPTTSVNVSDIRSDWKSTYKMYDIELFRIRPSTNYTIELYEEPTGASVGLIASVRVKSASTGHQDIDARVANITGQTPSYGVLMFALGSVFGFEGLVSVDAEGYAVWYYYTGQQTMAFDQWENGNIVMNTLPVGISAGNSRVNSILQIISPTGESRNKYVEGCSGTWRNWCEESHEASFNEKGNVVSIRSHASYDPEGVFFDGKEWNILKNDEVVVWNPTVNRGMDDMTILYELSDYLNKSTIKSYDMSNSFTNFTMRCGYSGSAAEPAVALEWMHASAAIPINNDYVLVALRNLDSLMLFDATGDGLEWSISSSIHELNNFSFLPDDAHYMTRFYNPHSPNLRTDEQNNTFLSVISDGSNAPGCTTSYFTHCFSRGMEYRLDLENMTATLTWQFEWPLNSSYFIGEMEYTDVFEFDGGSIVYMSHVGMYLVAFTSIQVTELFGGYSYAFEVDMKGRHKNVIKLPPSTWASGLYRAKPFQNVYMESPKAPFDEKNMMP